MTNPSVNSIVERLNRWATAYRVNPRHRFPSDLNAEFFPVDLEEAATTIAELQAANDLLHKEVSVCRDILMNPDPDSEADNVRLHREKCDALDRALAAESSLSRIRSETVEACAKAAITRTYSGDGDMWADGWDAGQEESAASIRSLGSTDGDSEK